MSVVLVTGAGGFLGSAIVRNLVRGTPRFADAAPVEHVVALLRPGGTTDRLDELAVNSAWSIERADVSDAHSFSSVLEQVRPRVIVHAALDHDSYALVDEDRFAVRPLSTMLRWLSRARGSRFVHTGSAWTLASGDRLDESAAVAPASPYAVNKARADVLLAEMAAASSVPWINLRLFNMFGRYEDSRRLLPTLVTKLSRGEPVDLTHGQQVRDFNDVDTVAQAFASALSTSERACRRVYHVGSGRGTTVRQFAAIVATLFGTSAEIRFGGASTTDEAIPALVANSALARRVLGWKPDADLPSAVKSAVDWRLAHLPNGGTPAVGHYLSERADGAIQTPRTAREPGGNPRQAMKR